jgi:hypothetical protein
VNFPGELTDEEIGNLYREYRQRAGTDPAAALVVRLIKKLVREVAWAIPHSSWKDRLAHALRQFGINQEEWPD